MDKTPGAHRFYIRASLLFRLDLSRSSASDENQGRIYKLNKKAPTQRPGLYFYL